MTKGEGGGDGGFRRKDFERKSDNGRRATRIAIIRGARGCGINKCPQSVRIWRRIENAGVGIRKICFGGGGVRYTSLTDPGRAQVGKSSDLATYR